MISKSSAQKRTNEDLLYMHIHNRQQVLLNNALKSVTCDWLQFFNLLFPLYFPLHMRDIMYVSDGFVVL